MKLFDSTFRPIMPLVGFEPIMTWFLCSNKWYFRLQANDELKRVKPIGSEVETIRSQQDEFKRLRESLVEPLGRAVEEVNRSGQSLVQSAASGVSTVQLERDLESINDKWNTLKEKVLWQFCK
jgi:hypothetical protein